jgi:predicted secreted protein
MATAGAENGTGIAVGMGGTVIGGQNSHSLTLNNQIIDITNKSSASFRELLPDEGTQSLDLTLDITFNTEATAAALRVAAGAKSDEAFTIVMPAGTMAFTGMVASYADTSPDGDKLTASVSIQSTGTITWF